MMTLMIPMEVMSLEFLRFRLLPLLQSFLLVIEGDGRWIFCHGADGATRICRPLPCPDRFSLYIGQSLVVLYLTDWRGLYRRPRPDKSTNYLSNGSCLLFFLLSFLAT